MAQLAEGKVKAIELDAVVTRGSSGVYGEPNTTEDLGRVAYWHRNPVRRGLVNLFSRTGKIKVLK